MKKVPYTNETDAVMHIGSVMITPGNTRDVDETHIPGYKQKEEVKEELPGDPLAELLSANVASVVAALPELTIEQIEKLGDMEQASGKPRKGVLSALAETLLNRAANKDLLDKIVLLSNEELAAALEEAGTDINVSPDYVAALETELTKRKTNAGAAE